MARPPANPGTDLPIPPTGPPSPRDRIDRRAWFLRGLMFVVVIALAAAVPLLYLPLAQLLHDDSSRVGPPNLAALVGLSGLVLVFVLYVALKQHELDRLRRQLEQEEREREIVHTRLSELSSLFQLSARLNLQLRLEDILEIIARRVVSTLKAQQASIMIYNPETNLLQTRASYGLESEFARNASKRLGEGIAGWVAERGQPVLLDSTSGAFASAYKRNRNITSAVCLPLKVGERCIGVLNVNRINHPEVFQDHHCELLQLFAEHVGAVVERAEVMERLGTRARELEVENLKLSQMSRLKDVFLSTASHELKTPLTSVIGYAELLDENDDRLSPEQRREFLDRMRAEASRLLGLIEDILDLTRIESGSLTLRCVSMSLNEVARAAMETTKSLATRHGVELVGQLADGLPEIVLDEVKMRQVLVNLLTNAIKFSPPRGRIVISTERDGDFLRASVSDQGQGIAPEDAPHIFELFAQGVRERGEQRGLGIGLHLVKRLTELHGGHVGVNSLPGKGSTFWVRLPVQPAHQGEVAPLRQAA
ncbi:MAG TPA: GAF domain-containing sensor histidine kinase [Terriglobales bacterium]|nr:GAF domain-containing sensor histidine kinase [Terriglobales bacterium]